jgi:Rab guanine nucleotide exchange factor SEC2
MVIMAREEAQKEHDIVQRRNDQLKAQLADTESLLKSHQDQLAELKQVLEQMTEVREDQTNPTTPSTPGVNKFETRDENNQDGEVSQPASIPDSVVPTHPTSFTNLLHMVLRTDLSAYDEFASLLRMSKNAVSSRVSSGSYGSMGLGLGLAGNSSGSSQQLQGNGSGFSLTTSGTFGSTPVTPTTPASTTSTGSTNGQTSVVPLKETKFYKRALAEDIEPTLRLDAAPGLSWLARRTVLNSVCEGTLVVEPMPTPTKLYFFPCSLCGESRKDPTHVRSHRFKTSESDSAQRYPLCNYCLGRVRSTCDYLGFLRVLKDGHWRADGQESERAAWEESVRLREQMFWCRVGGGVVPTLPHTQVNLSRSPNSSEEERREQEEKLSEVLERTGEIQPRDVTPLAERPPTVTLESSNKTGQSLARDDAAEDPSHVAQVHAVVSQVARVESEDGVNGETHNAKRASSQSTSSLQAESPGDGERGGAMRLSLTIPSTPE